MMGNTRDCCGTYYGYGITTSYTAGNAGLRIWQTSGGPSGGTTPLNAWTHYVGTYDGTTARFYQDGVQQGTLTQSVSLLPPSYNMHIGAFVSGGNPVLKFNGKIDDVRIYNRALSAAEVTALYGEYR
jgi:hypothetical protein